MEIENNNKKQSLKHLPPIPMMQSDIQIASYYCLLHWKSSHEKSLYATIILTLNNIKEMNLKPLH